MAAQLFDVRPMAMGDIPAVLEIDRQSFPIPWPERSYRYELTENSASHMLVAVSRASSPQILGYVGFWLIIDEAHISTLAVTPEMRGQGIGRRLLEEALEQAQHLGADMATLEVRVSNTRAIQLYEHHGFAIVGRRRRYYRDNNEDALLMTIGRLAECAAASRD
jgi:ribosomal-protein-alanine N-acetyltransferase